MSFGWGLGRAWVEKSHEFPRVRMKEGTVPTYRLRAFCIKRSLRLLDAATRDAVVTCGAKVLTRQAARLHASGALRRRRIACVHAAVRSSAVWRRRRTTVRRGRGRETLRRKVVNRLADAKLALSAAVEAFVVHLRARRASCVLVRGAEFVEGAGVVAAGIFRTEPNRSVFLATLVKNAASEAVTTVRNQLRTNCQTRRWLLIEQLIAAQVRPRRICIRVVLTSCTFGAQRIALMIPIAAVISGARVRVPVTIDGASWAVTAGNVQVQTIFTVVAGAETIRILPVDESVIVVIDGIAA